MINKNDVVQFNEKHDWCGCFGFVNEVKVIHREDEDGLMELDRKFMIGVPSPKKGTAYIFVLESENAIEYIGHAVLMPKESDENEN